MNINFLTENELSIFSWFANQVGFQRVEKFLNINEAVQLITDIKKEIAHLAEESESLNELKPWADNLPQLNAIQAKLIQQVEVHNNEILKLKQTIAALCGNTEHETVSNS